MYLNSHEAAVQRSKAGRIDLSESDWTVNAPVGKVGQGATGQVRGRRLAACVIVSGPGDVHSR